MKRIIVISHNCYELSSHNIQEGLCMNNMCTFILLFYHKIIICDKFINFYSKYIKKNSSCFIIIIL